MIVAMRQSNQYMKETNASYDCCNEVVNLSKSKLPNSGNCLIAQTSEPIKKETAKLGKLFDCIDWTANPGQVLACIVWDHYVQKETATFSGC